jgi:hypothetical protein
MQKNTEENIHTVASRSSTRAVFKMAGALRVRTVLKFRKASRAMSACFLKEFSDGIATIKLRSWWNSGRVLCTKRKDQEMVK